ncbi:GNAT family N-acetyltransferase [uncultured Acinetobacter sp.]|uniref:GNAT family N-acetyltransferase n=1 Tax=uncultured Acinetobacter sp. TaxID=165433 RepID=UPI00258763FA|nr:GNAT family N-acetyltransferase [uncultured Acinetobacter sp.]
MQKIEITQATPQDLDWIVALYQANTKQQLQQPVQGFVQDNPHFEQLAQKWIESSSIYKAEIGQQPAGFLVLQLMLSMNGPEIIQYIHQHADILVLNERHLADMRYATYGPILVHHDYRGMGVAKHLYDQAIQDLKQQSFDALIAFIDLENSTSLKVHIDGLGMRIIDKVVLASGQFYIIGQVV